jgi:putative resolvase
MNFTEWAGLPGIHPQTAYRWSRDSGLPVPAVGANARTVLIAPDAALAPGGTRGTALYARVSSHDQKASLDRRSKAGRLLADPAAVTAVEDRDRLGRMNTELTGAALPAHGPRLAELAPGEVAGGLVRDMTDVLTSCRARRYGQRPARNRAQNALRSAARDIGPSRPTVT